MTWMIIIVIVYIPIFYRIHNRLRKLEDEVQQLRQTQQDNIH